ncbi:hypothetical protein KCU73_g3655, partial [Aureobasidium melanogenum]
MQTLQVVVHGPKVYGIASIRASKVARLQPKCHKWSPKKYQGAFGDFGDIWGSGQNARGLATSPMHETIHIASKQGRPRADLGSRVIIDSPFEQWRAR